MINFTEDFNDQIVYDHDIEGGANNNGEINQLWGKEALSNALKLWLASLTGEIIRAPRKSGYVRQYFTKPMHEANVDEIKMSLLDGFNNDFVPYMKILELNIQPNYEKRRWDFYIKVYSPQLKLIAEVDESIKARV